MKKVSLILSILLALLLTMTLPIVSAESDSNHQYFSHYVVDEATGMVLDSYREDERSEIASMVKIMTLNIAFEKIDKGELSLEDKVAVSKNAAAATGSELFLEEGAEYSVSDLIKGIIVVSANDASIALAENIANNTDNFVDIMNEKAKEWNMSNTHFVNVTGLPMSGQYSSAKDVSIMMRHLLEHELYHDYATIWTEKYTHPSGNITDLTNTNKLVRFYDGCDGGKTGFTNSAGFCLSATARRGDMRVVSTVIGAPSSKARFKICSDLMNDAFRNYEVKVIKSKDDLLDNDIKVKGARGRHIDVGLAHDARVICGKNVASSAEIRYEFFSDVKAPVATSDVVGSAHVLVNGVEVDCIDIVAKCDIKKNNVFDNFLNIIR